jgi:excisionase family DNA binding protein
MKVQLVKTKAMSAALGITRGTLKKWVESRGLPCHVIDNHYYFRPERVRQWLDSQEEGE